MIFTFFSFYIERDWALDILICTNFSYMNAMPLDAFSCETDSQSFERISPLPFSFSESADQKHQEEFESHKQMFYSDKLELLTF